MHLKYVESIFPWSSNGFALRVRGENTVLPISRDRVRELRRLLDI